MAKKKYSFICNFSLLIIIFLVFFLQKTTTLKDKTNIFDCRKEGNAQKQNNLKSIQIETKKLKFRFEKEFYCVDFHQQAKTKEKVKTQKQEQKEQKTQEQEHEKNQQLGQNNLNCTFKIWISKKKKISFRKEKCKKELIIYEKNIEKFRKNPNNRKANLKIVEYKNILCGVDQYFEINKETNNMKSNFNFTNFKQIKNLFINYEIPRGLEPRIEQTTNSLIFTSKSNKSLIYLQESRPFIYNSHQTTCQGKYNLIQNGKNHFSVQYHVPKSFLNDQKAQTKNTKTNTNRKTNTNKTNHQSDVKWILIDPEYRTYIGGVSYDRATGTKYDQNSNVYALGVTQSSGFPVVGSTVYNPDYSGGLNSDIAIIKTKNGSNLLWSTYICKVGQNFFKYSGLSVDPSDNQAIISGTTQFPEFFPTTSNAWQNNSKNCDQNCPYGQAGLILKINKNGTDLVFSTLICGYGEGCTYVSSHEIIYDAEEETNYGDSYSIYFLGVTNGTQFPGYGLTNDNFKCESKNYGFDYIFGKISNDGSQLLQTKCIGGTNREYLWKHGLKVDKDYLVFQAFTFSMDFPVTTGAFQQTKPTNFDYYICVVGQLNITTFELIWASYLGGNNSDLGDTIRTDSNQDIWIGGRARSLDFPVTADAYQQTHTADELGDCFLTKISKDGKSLLYSTFLGTLPNAAQDEPNLSDLRIDKNNDQILLLVGLGIFQDTSVQKTKNYGNDSFLFYFNYTSNEFLKYYTYGGWAISVDILNNEIDTFVLTGRSLVDELITSNDAFQKAGSGSSDFLLSGTLFGCQMGYYSEDDQFESCYSCPQGTFNAEINQISKDNCTECEPGFYNDKNGATQCKKCIQGTYSSQMGQPQCEECPAGAYQPNEQATFCYTCTRGTYNPDQGSASVSSCMNCSVGTYGLKEAATSYQDTCRDCPLGTYNDEEGRSICKDCPISFYNEDTGSVDIGECRECPKGTFSADTALKSLSDCLKCPENKMSSSINSTSCEYCPIGYETNSNQDDCIQCQKGYYKNKTDISCTPCEENYFNNNEGMTFCLKCAIDDICLGGNECNIGRDPDSFCSQCIIGYYLKNGECKKCGANWIWSLWIAFILLVIFLVIKYKKKIQKVLLLKKNPIFEIYLTFFQLLATILSMNMTWDNNYIDTTIIAAISLFNMDIATIITPDCYQNWDFYSKYLIMVLVPIFLFGSICLFYLFLKVIRFINTNFFLISEKIDNINFEKLNIKIFYFITLCCRYLYLPETIITSIPFQKTWQAALNKYTLNYYPNISTDDEKYQKFYPWFVFFLIIYMVLIPIVFLIILILSKKNNFNDFWRKRFGWLWEFYKPKRFYWEIFKIIFKFLMIITPILISTSNHLTLVLVILLLITLIMIILILILKPYPRIIPFDKEGRIYKSFWEKISPEDLITIGLYLVLIATISSNIEQLKNIFYLFLNPIGIILAFMGTRKNLKEMWYKQKNTKLNRNGDDGINEPRMKKFSFVVGENPNLGDHVKKLSDNKKKINKKQNNLSTTSSSNTDSSSNSSSNFDSRDNDNENDIELNEKKNSDVELKNVKIKINSIGQQKIKKLKKENEKLKLIISELVDGKEKSNKEIIALKKKLSNFEEEK
ncbi:hypothetical protein M0812_13602 [Anaeramoeba flamelloides]|uniref:Tyrosine-protein kinase ephrin type A/B receptor-like domain-containing protein n=1 Tax=Anaeramoeba flamelloides TaxID=1746091 RepID=A0AAV7ZK94_9EUKA|nr:hypothetical protein M0812_13602 [Anaeramoeba flamelloides]